MTENMVGETGFEPATLCSQSKQEPNENSGIAVNRGESRPNRINDLLKGCKPSDGSVPGLVIDNFAGGGGASTGIEAALGRRWGAGPIACVIGCNPSDAGADRDDPTSLWWNRWFQYYGFGGYDAVNFYSFVASDPKACLERVRCAFAGEWQDRDELFANRDFVARTAKDADQVFICSGNIANEIDYDWNESVLEEIQTGEAPHPDLWCWGQTKSGAPTHPMARGKHRIDPLTPAILWRAA